MNSSAGRTAAVVAGGILAGLLAVSDYGFEVAGSLLVVFIAALVCRDLWTFALLGVLVSTTIANSQFSESIPALAPIRLAAGLFLAVVIARDAARLKRILEASSEGPAKSRVWSIFICSGGVLLIAASVSVLFSAHPSIALGQLAMLLLLGVMASSAAIRRHGGKSEGDLAFLHNFLSFTVVAGLVLGPALFGPGDTGRFSGIYSNPNALGLVCSLVIPLSLHLWRSGARLAPIIGSTAAVISIVLAQSRTPAIALLLGLIVATLVAPTTIRVVSSIIGFFIVILLWYRWGAGMGADESPLARYLQRFVTAGNESELFSAREGIWRGAIKTWRERPVFGYGYGTAPSDPAMQSDGFVRGIVANSYLQFLLETGIAGAAALLVLLVLLAAVSVNALRSKSRTALGYFVLVGLVVQFMESPLFGTGQAYPWVFWYVACFLVVGARGNVAVSSDLELASASSSVRRPDFRSGPPVGAYPDQPSYRRRN